MHTPRSWSENGNRTGTIDGSLSDSTVVFTGSLGMSRAAAADLAALAGMNVKAGVT